MERNAGLFSGSSKAISYFYYKEKERFNFSSPTKMNAWKENDAAPRWIDTWIQNPIPTYLRLQPPEKPVLSGIEPVRAKPQDSIEIAEFWYTHYGGSSWRMNMPPHYIESYLNDENVTAILLYDMKLGLIGTIFSVPCPLRMSHGAELKTSRVVEGLCVHREKRGEGIAGYLIKYIDWITCLKEPIVNIWSREEALWNTIGSTAIARHTYSYRLCDASVSPMRVARIQFGEFVELVWKQMKPTAPYIQSYKPTSYRGDLDCWCINDTWYVVVTNTRRITDTNKPIYEIVWNTEAGRKTQEILDAVCSMYNGVMYTVQSVGSPWIRGRSGQHAWYIYNYIPPAFAHCDIVFLREEL